MAKATIYGAPYSTYVRTVRMALEEKGAAYDLVPVDILKGESKMPEHLARHPFGKIPAFEHDGLVLYETCAITRYIDEAMEGPDLSPGEPRARALMTQAIGVIDSYAYGSMVATVFMQRALMPMLGGQTDEAAITGALPIAETSLIALDASNAGSPFLTGPELSLSDLFLVPVYYYFIQTPEGQAAAKKAPNLERWWASISTRSSVQATVPSFG